MDNPQVPASGGQVTCVRHPDRPTALRCVRCDRPACPECLTEASVGFQCVDCVRQGNKGVRRAVTVAGAELNTKPLMVPLLIAVNVLVFVAQNALGKAFNNEFTQYNFMVAHGEWWRMITAGFMHANLMHILFNMYALWVLGRDLEAAFGRVRFLALYFLSLLGGSVAVLVFDSPASGVLGASGAVFGLFGALGATLYRLKLSMRPLLFILALNIALPFLIPSANISLTAHLGGLVVGAVVGAGIVYAPLARRNQIQLATVAGVFVALIVIAYVRSEQILAVIGVLN
ncbi:rhomboid family intramembrane serine protease [Pseudonocardiaceae bacterium YIM PH 21723]|nr:rhomboid family intramembrane serine protease [Pseudonocardiaceae bacterium YIM PH 21723]